MKGLFEDGPKQPPRREDFDEVPEGTVPRMKNEGGYDFSLEESEDGSEIVLEVDVGKFLDTSLIKADVQVSVGSGHWAANRGPLHPSRLLIEGPRLGRVDC